MNSAAMVGGWRWRLAALGLAQIIAWGTLFYAIAILAGDIAQALATSQSVVFGAFTLSLVISGVSAPYAGRAIDAGYCREVLGSSSVLAAAGFIALAQAQGPWLLYASWALLGLAMGGGLYDAAFAVLHRTIAAERYRRAVTTLTLYAGFASTVFWPVSRWLMEAQGWRGTVICFAGLHLLCCLPVYLTAVPRVARLSWRVHAGAPTGPTLEGRALQRFRWLAAALAFASFVVAVLSAHLITLLVMGGLPRAEAVFVGTLFGPMQVLARVIEYAWAGKVRAVTVGSVSFALLALALGVLSFAHDKLLLPVIFALLYGASNGIMTIIRGTVPAALFAEASGFGALLGRLARPSFIAKAAAPFLFSLVLELPSVRGASFIGLGALAFTAWACYERARRV